jgi:hypothetical protein
LGGVWYHATQVSVAFGKEFDLYRTMTKEALMRRFTWLSCLLAGSLLLGAAEKETHKSVTGWVLDSACAFTKGLKQPISRECALACAK